MTQRPPDDRPDTPPSADGVPTLVRLLIRFYPTAFRQRYGAAMLDFYAERFAAARLARESSLRLWRRTLADLIASVWIQRVQPGQDASILSPIASTPSLSLGDAMFVLAQELVQATRSLRRSPAFTLAAIVTLALGISATTAIFSVVDSVLLHPLPFPHPDRVVVPMTRRTTTGETWSVAYADFMDWRDAHVFGQVAAYQPSQMDITGSDEPVRVQTAAVSPQFFAVLGAPAALGRVLQPSEFDPQAPRAVVISDALWRTQFGGRRDIIGQEVEINAFKRQIIGVLPPGLAWPLDVNLWVPLRLTTEQDPDLQRRDNFVYEAIARLAPGSTIANTGARMAALAARASDAYPDIRKDISTVPTPVLESLLGPTTPRALWTLLGAVGLLLLIGCMNVANLQLARATARHRELAVRAALGASRYRLVRQTFIESGILAFVGGGLGILLARGMVELIVAAAPPSVSRIETAAVSLPALAFAFAISIGVALLFGLVPAIHAARSDAGLVIGDGGRRTSTGRAGTRTRRVLVVVELAMSVVLLVGAGWSTRSIMRLSHVDTGFDTHNVLTASISIPGARYDTKAKVVGLIYQLRDRLASAPGVEAAGIASASPLGGGGFYLGRMMMEEGKGPGPAGEVRINWNVTTPGYFSALRIPIVRGRDFTAHDDSASQPVMIVNEAFAKAMFANENPIGKRAMSSRDEKVYREIVGVVGNVKYYGASDSTRALVWVPYAQNNAWHQGIITVRTRSNPGGALPLVKRELRALDGGIALANVATMDETMAQSMASDRLVAILLAAFAGLALVLAAVGVFGVLSYMIEQRTHELGIRVALGAQRGDVLRLVAWEAVPMVVIGLMTGVLAAFGLSRFVRSIMYEMTTADPVTLGAVALVLGTVGVIAALVPARRAARVDPVIALRGD